MGTVYVRDKSVPTSISLEQAESEVIFVDNVYSKLTIGNVLDINLRQKAGSELPWVSLEQGSPSLIKIVPAGVAPGDYTLILQSFDNNGSVKSTLKTDLITITVKANCFVEKIWFEPSQMQISYPIGDGIVNFSLPEVKQSPDCGKKFSNIDIVSVNVPVRVRKS